MGGGRWRPRKGVTHAIYGETVVCLNEDGVGERGALCGS